MAIGKRIENKRFVTFIVGITIGIRKYKAIIVLVSHSSLSIFIKIRDERTKNSGPWTFYSSWKPVLSLQIIIFGDSKMTRDNEPNIKASERLTEST